MIEPSALAKVLHRLADEIAAMVEQHASHASQIDPHELHCHGLKLRCQAEIVDKGLVG